MSQSAAPSVSNGAENANKKRRLGGPEDGMSMAESPSGGSQSQQHIPKRGARACTNCRKGKNRCEGEVSSLSLAVVRPARSPMARLPRPGPAHYHHRSLASLQALSSEWHTLYLRKAREEKCASSDCWAKCRVRMRFLLCLTCLIPRRQKAHTPRGPVLGASTLYVVTAFCLIKRLGTVSAKPNDRHADFLG